MDWTRWLMVIVGAVFLMPRNIAAWNFLALNTTNEDVTVIHVSVVYYRAFLSLKSDLEDNQIPTLVESTWPETVFSTAQPFPNKRSHHLTQRSSKSCRKLMQSYRTAVDHSRGYLWILDNGSEACQCGPKLVILSLNFFNQEVNRKCLTHYKSNSFTDMILESTAPGLRQNHTRAFLSVQNKDYLLSYSLATDEVKKLKIQPSHCDSISLKPISIGSMALTSLQGRTGGSQALLYDSIDDRLLYVDLRIGGGSQGHLYAIQLGFLLGRTNSMVVDPDGRLYYITERDGALFRWSMKSKLTAENHQVLHFQTTEAAQLLIGAQGATWVINEKPVDEFDLIHTEKILSHYSRESHF